MHQDPLGRGGVPKFIKVDTSSEELRHEGNKSQVWGSITLIELLSVI